MATIFLLSFVSMCLPYCSIWRRYNHFLFLFYTEYSMGMHNPLEKTLYCQIQSAPHFRKRRSDVACAIFYFYWKHYTILFTKFPLESVIYQPLTIAIHSIRTPFLPSGCPLTQTTKTLQIKPQFLFLLISQAKFPYNIQKLLIPSMNHPSALQKKYSKYTREMRVELIRLVDEEGLSTAHAARVLGIKQTSACRIMKSYHNHHKIFERKADRLQRQEKETLPSPLTEFLPALEEEGAQNNKVTNRTYIPRPRTPLSVLGGNIPSTLSEQHGKRQEFIPIGPGIPFQMANTVSPFFPLYYTGMYPLMFNCFV